MNAADSITSIRTQLAERRLERRRSRRLKEELASYSSESDRLELDAILNRHTAEQIEDLEKLVSRSAVWLPTQR